MENPAKRTNKKMIYLKELTAYQDKNWAELLPVLDDILKSNLKRNIKNFSRKT